MLKQAVYKSYVRPAKLNAGETWCLWESEMGILQRTVRSIVRAMCVEYSSKIERGLQI